MDYSPDPTGSYVHIVIISSQGHLEEGVLYTLSPLRLLDHPTAIKVGLSMLVNPSLGGCYEMPGHFTVGHLFFLIQSWRTGPTWYALQRLEWASCVD